MASAETLGLAGLTYSATRDPLFAIVEALRPRKYIKPVLQPSLTALIDFDRAVPRSASLQRLLVRFDGLLASLDSAPSL